MKFRAAIALFALALPAFAQHGGAHAGSFGNRGFSSAGAFSSHSPSRPAFSQPGNFARSAPPVRYGSQHRPMPGAAFRGTGQQNHSGLRIPYNGSSRLRTPYNGNRFVAGRPAYDPRAAGSSRGRDRDRFDARRRQFQSWYFSTYLNWPSYGYGSGYPYLIDPNFYNLGLYNWGDSDNSASDSSQPGSYEPDSYSPDQAASDQSGPAPPFLAPYPDQRPPYPGEGYVAPLAQAGVAAPAVPAPAESAQPLTVIFNTGRSPIEVENYLMTATVLTDLDSEHYEQIPLDQVDLAATRRFNTFAGVEFQVPAASRN